MDTASVRSCSESCTVVDDWSDDGNVKRLVLHLGAWDNIVIELLAAASLTTWLIPRLARWVGWPLSALWVLGGLLRRLQRHE